MKGLILLIFVLAPFSVSALETDNYLVWSRELRDSSLEINDSFNGFIEDVLARQSPDMSCEDVRSLIGKKIHSHWVHDNPVENRVFTLLATDQIYPHTFSYVPESIYRDPFRFYIPAFGLAPNIQVNGFYLGTDKLSHFASTGWSYFKTFQRSRTLGKSSDMAEDDAIAFGILDEKTVHGYWASGVFSYADLEANYQGYLFYRSLCDGPLLRHYNGAWKMIRSFDIKEYISGNWDESYNPNHYLPGNWKKVAPALRSYCPEKESSLVKNRFRSYRERTRPSAFMNGLRSHRDLPVPQSMTELCL